MRRVLLVDDDQEMQALVSEVLRQEEYEVFTAPDGYQAMEMLELYSFDLMLVDIELPFMNGFQFVRSFQMRLKSRFIPFMFISSKNRRSDIDRAINIGATTYLIKPFSTEDLVKRVDRCLMYAPIRPLLNFEVDDSKEGIAKAATTISLEIKDVSDTRVRAISKEDLGSPGTRLDLGWSVFANIGYPSVPMKVYGKRKTEKGTEYELRYHRPKFIFLKTLQYKLKSPSNFSLGSGFVGLNKVQAS